MVIENKDVKACDCKHKTCSKALPKTETSFLSFFLFLLLAVMPMDDNGATPYTTSPTSLSSQQHDYQENESLTWDGRRAAIHFSLPEHPVTHTGYSFIHQPSSSTTTFWDILYRLYDLYSQWLEEKKQQMHIARQLRGRSRSLTEIPFCMAAFISIYATFMLFRGLGKHSYT